VPNFISEDQIEQALLQKLHHVHGYDVLECGRIDGVSLLHVVVHGEIGIGVIPSAAAAAVWCLSCVKISGNLLCRAVTRWRQSEERRETALGSVV